MRVSLHYDEASNSIYMNDKPISYDEFIELYDVVRAKTIGVIDDECAIGTTDEINDMIITKMYYSWILTADPGDNEWVH